MPATRRYVWAHRAIPFLLTAGPVLNAVCSRNEGTARMRRTSEERVGRADRDQRVVLREVARVLLEHELVREVLPQLPLKEEVLGDEVLRRHRVLPHPLLDAGAGAVEVVEELDP